MPSLVAFLCLLCLPIVGFQVFARRAPPSTFPWASLAAGVGLMAVMAIAATHDFPARKLLTAVAKATGLMWYALWILVIAEWRHRPRCVPRLAALTVLFAFLSIFGNHRLAGWAQERLIATQSGEDPATMAPCDAVCVLGGASVHAIDGRPQFGVGAERLTTAIRLWRSGKAPILVTSGPYDLPGDTATLWQDLGVPAAAIIRITGPLNTSAEIEAYGKLIAQQHWTRVGLLTASWHMPRAMRLARRRGIALVPITCDLPAMPTPFQAVDLVPSAEGLDVAGQVTKEWLGMALGQ